jgi:hypothetical protein
MKFLVTLNRPSLMLTFIKLHDDDLDDDESYQSLVDYVSRGLTDDESRNVFKIKITSTKKPKEVKCELFDEHINIVPEKCKHDWILVDTDADNDEVIRSLYYSKDANKYQKSFLNTELHNKVNELIMTL